MVCSRDINAGSESLTAKLAWF